ncbi:MAG: chemotaxis protein CheD [Litoreibacter sp.]
MQFNWDTHSTIAVPQGEHNTSAQSEVVFSALLGSCVSVCLHDQQNKIGGMNHFLLPGGDGNASSGEKFGAYAMEILINELVNSQANREALTAKVFGGSAMSIAHEKIGRSNGEFAIRFLQSEGIECTGSSLGGTLARRIQFHPTSGRVRQFLVPEKVDEKPTAVQPTSKSNAVEPDIVLF